MELGTIYLFGKTLPKKLKETPAIQHIEINEGCLVCYQYLFTSLNHSTMKTIVMHDEDKKVENFSHVELLRNKNKHLFSSVCITDYGKDVPSSMFSAESIFDGLDIQTKSISLDIVNYVAMTKGESFKDDDTDTLSCLYPIDFDADENKWLVFFVFRQASNGSERICDSFVQVKMNDVGKFEMIDDYSDVPTSQDLYNQAIDCLNSLILDDEQSENLSSLGRYQADNDDKPMCIVQASKRGEAYLPLVKDYLTGQKVRTRIHVTKDQSVETTMLSVPMLEDDLKDETDYSCSHFIDIDNTIRHIFHVYSNADIDEHSAPYAEHMVLNGRLENIKEVIGHYRQRPSSHWYRLVMTNEDLPRFLFTVVYKNTLIYYVSSKQEDTDKWDITFLPNKHLGFTLKPMTSETPYLDLEYIISLHEVRTSDKLN